MASLLCTIFILSLVHWGGASGAITSFWDRAFYADLNGGGNRFYLKPAALAISARRAGTTATWDQLNKYFGLMQMPIITSRYWNMAYFLKCMEVGKKFGIPLPPQEPFVFTNFVRS